MPNWRMLLEELVRHLPIDKAIDALWQQEHEWEFDQHIERITPTVRISGAEPPDVSDLPPGARQRLDVPLSDALPEPLIEPEYLPKTSNQAKGVTGELHLANRAVARIPGEKVIYYGIPGGTTGADIISVGKDGTISVWDSKWRGSVRSITQVMRGYQKTEALEAVTAQVQRVIHEAWRRGDLKGVDAMKAMRNAAEGNFFINTIGTGNAHSAVVQQVIGGKPGAIRRIPK